MQLYSEKRPDYFSSARLEILDLLPNFSARVLEVGCGSGQTLEYLKAKKLCTETVGIELIEEAASKARESVDTVYCMDVEKGPLPADIGRFDLILLLDVLEHLVDPWMFLRHLKEHHLNAGGRFIISLPNARHFTLVLPLLFGKFEYTERGILDKTHLRFFTKTSALKMLNDAGLVVESIKPTSLDIRLNSGKLNLVTLGIFSGFLTSQYIFRAVTSDDEKGSAGTGSESSLNDRA